jgi:hypothetical protein
LGGVVFVLHGVDDARSKVGADGVHASECTNLNQLANRCDLVLPRALHHVRCGAFH